MRCGYDWNRLKRLATGLDVDEKRDSAIGCESVATCMVEVKSHFPLLNLDGVKIN